MLRMPVHCAILYLTSATCLIGAYSPRSAGAERPVAPAAIAGEHDADPEVESVELPALWAAPGARLGQTVRFVVQLHSVEEHWNPFLTRFGTDAYVQLRFWADSQMLWLPGQFQNPLGVAYVRRSAAWLPAVRAARPYQRFEVVAHVAQVFLGRPWMEVREIRPLAGSLTEGALVHAGRGIALFWGEHWRLARNEFERARAVALHEPMLAQLDQLIEVCRRLGGDDEPVVDSGR